MSLVEFELVLIILVKIASSVNIVGEYKYVDKVSVAIYGCNT